MLFDNTKSTIKRNTSLVIVKKAFVKKFFYTKKQLQNLFSTFTSTITIRTQLWTVKLR